MRLAVAAALLFAGASSLHAQTWIRVDADGWAERLEKPPAAIAPGTHAWLLSDGCAPQSVTSIAGTKCTPLNVRQLKLVSTEERASDGEQAVLWATEAMLAEIPDALLPSVRVAAGKVAEIRVPDGEKVLVRAAGAVASPWVPLSPGVTTIRASRSTRVNVDARFAGAPARHARIEITPADDPANRAVPFRGAGDGTVGMPPVPANGFLKLLVWSDEGLPLVTVASGTSLPSRVDLAKGATVAGDVSGVDDQAVANAAVTVKFAVPREDVFITRRGVTDAKGRFGFSGVSNGRLQWAAEKDGFAPKRGVLPMHADVDALHIRLDRGRTVQFLVRSGSALLDKARVTSPNERTAQSDAKGVASLSGAPTEPFSATVRKDGYLTRVVPVPFKTDAPVAVDLTRAASIRARAVRASDGAPAGPGTVQVESDGGTDVVAFGDDGRIEIGALVKSRVTLEIRVAGLAPFRVPARDVATGESVDLGAIRLAAGLTLQGRVTAAENDAPVPRATIRAFRTNTFSPLLSLVRHDWIESVSGDDGTFAITGAQPGPYIVVASAAGRAPVVRTGTTTDDTGAVDLGSIALDTGHAVRVSCEPAARCGTEASIILPDAEWMPLAAPMNEGKATIAPVAAGTATLRLAKSGAVLHEEKISVRTSDATDITVRLDGATVTGRVVRGGEPVRTGMVTFVTGTSRGRLITIDHTSDTGVVASENFGSSAARLTAPVRQDGAFELDDVAPGDYLVSWSDSGTQSPQRAVTISGSAQAVDVELASSSVEGSVRLPDGRTPTRASVTANQRGRDTTVLTNADGTFRLIGLDAGTIAIHASSFDPEARTDKTLELRAGQTEAVQLVLDGAADDERAFSVTSGGAPVANAFVFVRSASAMRVAMTGADGRASLTLADSDAHAELAVFAPQTGWAFWPVRTLERSTPLDLQRSASTIIVRASAPGSVALWSPSGFPLHEALALLGAPLATSAAAPLRVDRLPRGSYVIAAGAARRNVTLEDLSDISF